MTRLVVDASVVVKWLAREPDSPAANGVLASDLDLCAPRLLAAEVVNALRNKVLRNAISREQAEQGAALVPGLPIAWFGDEALCADAMRLALGIGASVYDCLYLALAQRLDAPLITADSQFAQRLDSAGRSDAVVTLDRFAEWSARRAGA